MKTHTETAIEYSATAPLPYFAAPYGDPAGVAFVALSRTSMEAGEGRDREIAACHDRLCIRWHDGRISLHQGRRGNLLINRFERVAKPTVADLDRAALALATEFPDDDREYSTRLNVLTDEALNALMRAVELLGG